MSLQALIQAGIGGAGLDKVVAAVKELQGLKIAVLAGAAADTKINVAAIRAEDTILSMLQFTVGGGNLTAIVDRTGTASITDLRASGTLTLGTVVAGNTATVRGKVYTFRAAPEELGTSTYEVALGADAAAAAANLAAKINQVDPGALIASANSNVVTVKAILEGTAGNAFTLVGGTNVTASAATLENGTATGGVQNSVSTSGHVVLLAWFDKR